MGYGITAPLYIRLTLHLLAMGFREFAMRAIVPIVPWALVFAAVIVAHCAFLPAGRPHPDRVVLRSREVSCTSWEWFALR